MKLSKYIKNLKNEFNSTTSDYEVKEHHIKNRHQFKIRYVFIGLAFALVAFLVINHISVATYNKKIASQASNYSLEAPAVQKYTSKKQLKSAIIYEPEEKTSVLSSIGSIFTGSLISCGSSTETLEYRSDTWKHESSITRNDPTIVDGNSYTTNVTEVGIDEGDVAKCDGTYIYSLFQGTLSIYNLEGSQVLEKKDLNATNMYVYENRLVLYSEYYLSIYTFENDGLKMEKEYDYDYVDSRLTGNTLYFIAEDSLKLDKVNYDNAYYDGTIDPNCLYRIYKIDLDNLTEKEGDLITSYSTILYMSDNYFYFTSQHNYSLLCTSVTTIFILDLDLNGYASMREEGYALNKYSFSEYNGYFRYVLTDRTKEIRNSLYVYDLENKELAGSLENQIGLANEDVKSVRYDGNLCYVCTYRNTDPLYVIDVTDPKNIEIKSELHVEGYSGYLHTFTLNEEEYILGVGYNEYLLPKISIYKNTDGTLEQVGKSLVLIPKDYENFIAFDEYYCFYNYEDGYFNILNDSFIGYFFYTDGNHFYFGSPITSTVFTIFEINVDAEEPIQAYKNYEIKSDETNEYESNLRCFLINYKIYCVGNGSILLGDF